jgi:5-deoxy-5-amino-3-dehydroquinate synthase
MNRTNVELTDNPYSVLVGPGSVEHVAELLPRECKRVAVVSQPGIQFSLPIDLESKRFDIGTGESSKTFGTVEQLCGDFVDFGLTRGDCVVALGGGMVTDVAGFAASIYHRGTSVVHVPTTLLAQIDAAIGGKTGVNLASGKNLIGTFWQPSGVICDTDLLESLPEREYKSGLGEMAKYHFLGDQVGIDVANMLELSLADRITKSVEIKARVVAADEREGSLRAILNYGHTLAHALEFAGEFDLRHGEAVAIGIHFASLLAKRLGRIDDQRVVEHLEVLRSYGLSSGLPARCSSAELLTYMRRDKKAINGLTFVLDGTNGVEPVRVEPEIVLETLGDMPRASQ